MPLKAKVKFPVINKSKTIDVLDKHMNDQVTRALRAWLIAATSQVPVLTGASKASFLKLAFQAKVALNIRPRSVNRIALGTSTSGGYIYKRKGIRYGWRWSSRLDYIQYVDRHNQFLAAGEAALRNFKLQNLPQPVVE